MIRPLRTTLLTVCLLASPGHAAFVNNNDGTVTDTDTGLSWDRCPLGMSWNYAGMTNRCINASGSQETFTWTESLAAVIAANAASHLGYTDWRLPTIDELATLVDSGKPSPPKIDETTFPDTPPSAFWSSSESESDPSMAWHLFFGDGAAYLYYKFPDYYVRLVRGGQTDGVCGGAQGTPSVSAPTTNLCAVGTMANPDQDASSHIWHCVGANGGATAQCSAPRQHLVIPSAGAGGTLTPDVTQPVTHGQSIAFTVTPDVGQIATVSGCGGTLAGTLYTTGPITSNCSVIANFAHAEVDGQCGGATSIASLLAPVANLCAAGNPEAVTSANGQHAWTCRGAYGGGDAQCAAPGQNTASAGGPGGSVTAHFDGAGCSVESISVGAAPAGGPSGVTLPFGVIDFALSGCSGGSVTVTTTYSGSVEGMHYWKYVGGTWKVLPATLAGNTATFTIADNGPFDTDPAAGRIADPGGPGLGAGGVTAIPTLPPWAMVLLVGLFGAMAFVFLRSDGPGRRCA